ncbi:hypothetical protein [Castellaniella sp.]|nr:hypothetical protein [Castellaniella sp.]
MMHKGWTILAGLVAAATLALILAGWRQGAFDLLQGGMSLC